MRYQFKRVFTYWSAGISPAWPNTGTSGSRVQVDYNFVAHVTRNKQKNELLAFVDAWQPRVTDNILTDDAMTLAGAVKAWKSFDLIYSTDVRKCPFHNLNMSPWIFRNKPSSLMKLFQVLIVMQHSLLFFVLALFAIRSLYARWRRRTFLAPVELLRLQFPWSSSASQSTRERLCGDIYRHTHRHWAGR